MTTRSDAVIPTIAELSAVMRQAQHLQARIGEAERWLQANPGHPSAVILTDQLAELREELAERRAHLATYLPHFASNDTDFAEL